MEITWLAHSCFRLRGERATVLTDPFPDAIGLRMGGPSATIVTVSHAHSNHNHQQGVTGEFHLIKGPGEYEVSGVYVRGITTPRGQEDPANKRNTAYFIEMDGLNLCHLGDISSPSFSAQGHVSTPVDVLLVPVGGVCTTSLSQIAQIIQALEPRLILPMHYRIPGLQVELGELQPFLREMGIREVQPQNRLSATPTNLPQETTVVVLTPLAAAVGG